MKGEAVSAQLWIQYGEQNEISSSTPPTHVYGHISTSISIITRIKVKVKKDTYILSEAERYLIKATFFMQKMKIGQDFMHILSE